MLEKIKVLVHGERLAEVFVQQICNVSERIVFLYMNQQLISFPELHI